MKRGSVSTEPGIDLDDFLKFPVDAAACQGMSGSPVIFRRTGLCGFKKYDIGNDNAVVGTIQGFGGVYSGRIGSNDQLQAQLEIVWKKTVIEEILVSKVTGDSNFQKV